MGTGTVTYDTGVEASASPREPQLILVLSAATPLEPSRRLLLGNLRGVAIGRGPSCSIEVRSSPSGRLARVDLPDVAVSTRHAVLTRVGDAWLLEDQQSKNGTLLSGQRLERRTRLVSGSIIEIGPFFFLFKEGAVHDTREIVADGDLVAPHRRLATYNGDLAATFARLVTVARSDVPVLVLGKTGTGKEVVAAALHELSGRRGPLVPVHLAAYPESLLGAELFGHRRGAFTGAVDDRAGLIRAAHDGTLFLDEVGDLPMVAQVALLRVLETRIVQPIGATASHAVDVRLVAATNQDLDALVPEGRFRSDLLARLAGFVVRLPPLAQRIEDLGLLLRGILRKQGQSASTTFTARSIRTLLLHDWPMNIRELEKTCTAAMLLSNGGPVDWHHLSERLSARATPPLGAEPLHVDEALLDGRDRHAVEALLRAHQGNVMAAARAVGRAPVQIYRWIHRHGIDLESMRLAADR
jgi:DNA-binding NtrC family response regulator